MAPNRGEDTMAFDHTENFLSDGRDPRHLATRHELESIIEDQDQGEIAQRRAEFAQMQQRHRTMMDELVAQKRSMFGRTPPEVSVNALALAVEEAHLMARLRAAQGQPEERVADIRLFQPQIQGREVAYQAEGQKKPSFVDDGKNIYVPGYQDDVALLASLQLAQMRWGLVKVSGNDDFKERVVQLAAEHDLKLANEDLARQVQLRRMSPGTLSAPTEQERRAAEQLHNELDASGPAAEPPSQASKPLAHGEQPKWLQPKMAAPEEAAEVTTNSTRRESQKPDAQESDVIEDYPEADKQSAGQTAEQPDAEEKSWVQRLQEERRERQQAAAQKPATANAEVQGGSDQAQMEDDEPEHEPDLGYGDGDEDFSVDVPSAPPPVARPVTKKAVSAEVRLGA